MARDPGRPRAAPPRRPLPAPSGRFGALRHADFRFLLSGNLFTQMGQWSQQLGKGWLVHHDLGGSNFQLGAVAFAQGAGMFIMSPVGGALADRLNRQHLMLFSQVSLALVALVLALIVMTDVVEIWHVYILAFLSGSFFALNNPARMSMIHDIVGREDLTNAVALNAVVMNSMRVIGPAVGGVLLVAVGTEGTFFLQAAGYVFGVVSVLLIRRRFTAGRTSAPFFQSIADGIRYARGDRTIRVLLSVSLLAALLGMSMTQLLVAFSTDVLGQEEGGFAALFIVLGVGGLAGAVMLVWKGDIRLKGLVYFCAAVGTGLIIAAMGAVGNLAFSFAAMVALGATTASTLALGNTLVQTNVKDEFRGRAMSLYFLSFSLSPLGAMVAGALGDWTNLRISFVVVGLCLAVPVTWLMFTRRDLWRL